MSFTLARLEMTNAQLRASATMTSEVDAALGPFGALSHPVVFLGEPLVVVERKFVNDVNLDTLANSTNRLWVGLRNS